MKDRCIFSIKGILNQRFIINLLLLAYILWEIYWYRRVGLAFIRWHTHLMLYFIAFALLLQIFSAGGKSGKPEFRLRAGMVAFSILFILFLSELFLALTGFNKTNLEKSTGSYYSLYIPGGSSYYHIWTGKDHWLTTPEFSYWRPNNSLGFADTEWPVSKKPRQLRLLALGDSFTEGDGAPYDSNYVQVLKRKLQASGMDVLVMNAGVCGSDPCNNYINLRDLLLKYKPDVILQSVGTNDFDYDMLLRGGLERFRENHQVVYHAAPWWEPVYAISYVGRLCFKAAGYDQTLRKQGISRQEYLQINTEAKDLFRRYKTLCSANNIRLIVAVHPQCNELEKGRYNFDFTQLEAYNRDSLHLAWVDLMPAYLDSLQKRHAQPEAYFWKQDGHHNGRGYQLMAETTYPAVLAMLKDTQ